MASFSSAMISAPRKNTTQLFFSVSSSGPSKSRNFASTSQLRLPPKPKPKSNVPVTKESAAAAKAEKEREEQQQRARIEIQLKNPANRRQYIANWEKQGREFKGGETAYGFAPRPWLSLIPTSNFQKLVPASPFIEGKGPPAGPEEDEITWARLAPNLFHRATQGVTNIWRKLQAEYSYAFHQTDSKVDSVKYAALTSPYWSYVGLQPELRVSTLNELKGAWVRFMQASVSGDEQKIILAAYEPIRSHALMRNKTIVQRKLQLAWSLEESDPAPEFKIVGWLYGKPSDELAIYQAVLRVKSKSYLQVASNPPQSTEQTEYWLMEKFDITPPAKDELFRLKPPKEWRAKARLTVGGLREHYEKFDVHDWKFIN